MIKDKHDQLFIQFQTNGDVIGLFHKDGKTMNCKHFYYQEKEAFLINVSGGNVQDVSRMKNAPRPGIYILDWDNADESEPDLASSGLIYQIRHPENISNKTIRDYHKVTENILKEIEEKFDDDDDWTITDPDGVQAFKKEGDWYEFRQHYTYSINGMPDIHEHKFKLDSYTSEQLYSECASFGITPEQVDQYLGTEQEHLIAECIFENLIY